MSQKKAIKSLTLLEEQLAALKETVNVERLTILGLEEVLAKIKFVHPDIHMLIKTAATHFQDDVKGQEYLKEISVQQAEKQREIAIQHANNEYENNLKRVRKILIQEVFYKIHKLKTTSYKPSQIPISRRIDRMRLMSRLTEKHVMPIVHSSASTAELEFDLNIIKRNSEEKPFHMQHINDPSGVLIYFVPENHLIRYFGKSIKAGDTFYLIMNHQKTLAVLNQVRSREVIAVKIKNEEKVFTVTEIRNRKIKIDPIERPAIKVESS